MPGKIPDFFIIGAPKCGTTTLHNWLAQHPNVYAPIKETGFFSQDLFPTAGLPTHIPSLDHYQRIYTKHGGRLCGEATPKYLHSAAAVPAILEQRPDARLIVCLRDPVDLAISYHTQMVKEGREREFDFFRAWTRSRNYAAHESEVAGHINYRFWASVGAPLARLFRLIDSKSVCVLRLAELSDRPRQSYLRVLNFLGLPDDGKTSFGRLNERKRVKNVELHRHLVRLRRTVLPYLDPMLRLAGLQGTGLMRAINRFNVREGHYSSAVAPEMRATVSGDLQEDTEIAISVLKREFLCRDFQAL